MRVTRYVRRGITLTVAGLCVTAAANRALASKAADLDPPLPGESDTYRWRGIDVAVTEAGDPANPDLVLIHGIDAAATSYVFRGIVEELAEDFHVIAPDLPGFGKSERPPLVYSASLYESFVTDFLDDTAETPAVVASSLSAAYVAAAARNVDLRQLVLVCPTATPIGRQALWLRTTVRSPLVGTALFNLVVSKPSLRYFSTDHGYYDPAALTDEELSYRWQTAHQMGARYAPASFFSGFLDAPISLEDELAAVEPPVTLVWGREAETPSVKNGRQLAEAADSRLVVFDYSRLLPHAEHPRKFVEFLREDLAVEA